MSTTLEPAPTPTPGNRRALAAIIIAVVAVAVSAVAIVLAARSSHTTTRVGPSPSSTPIATSSALVTTTSASATSNPASATASPSALYDGYVPLWPFAGLADAAQWQAGYASSGVQPWHLDPGQTALSFTQGYLGFTELDHVFRASAREDGAHVDVGYLNPNGGPQVAATVHLIRLGTGTNAPWEVVGTDDTTFTLDQPAYASTVASPLRVAGVITGVDESVSVAVRRLASSAPLGTAPGVPAGGTAQPWSTSVTWPASPPGPATVVASTGGHLQRVERFAITGVLL